MSGADQPERVGGAAPEEEGRSWVREREGDRELVSNWLFQLRQERYRSRRSGKTHDYFVVRLTDSVNVIALTPDRRLLMVEQFRAGSGRDSLETPGGLIDEGEDPLEAAARELREETGYEGDPPRLLCVVWSNPSIMTSKSYTVVITNATRVADPKLDEGEEVRLELVPARRLPELIRNGKIGHALAVQGLLWWLVSELPDSPLPLELERPERAGIQFHVGKLMGLVAAAAVLLGVARLLSGTNRLAGTGLWFLLAMPVAWLVVSRVLDPRSPAVLLRHRELSGPRLLQRMFTFLGVLLTLYAAGLFVLTLWN